MSALPRPDTLFVSGPSKPTPDTPEGGDFAITDGGTNVLAEVFHRVRDDRTQNAHSIATLFAAAPDLLEALRDVLPYAAACVGASWRQNPPSDSVINAARDAIARATGRPS